MISHHITSYHIISHHITSYHIISYHIISHLIISHRITSHHITLHHIITHNTSHPAVQGGAALCATDKDLGLLSMRGAQCRGYEGSTVSQQPPYDPSHCHWHQGESLPVLSLYFLTPTLAVSLSISYHFVLSYHFFNYSLFLLLLLSDDYTGTQGIFWRYPGIL